MERKLNLFFVLPLREMALRRIAVILVNKPEILSSMHDYSFEIVDLHQDERMVTFSEKMNDSVSKLPLPASLIKEMTPQLKAVGLEILKWKKIHDPHLAPFEMHAFGTWDMRDNPCFREFDTRIFEKLCWTTAGAIDYQKTSEKLVHSDVVNNVQRIKLACFYCLEDCIPAIWNELPEQKRKSMFFDDRGSRVRVTEPHLQLFLPYILRKNSWWGRPALEIIRGDCLKYSALWGNKTTTEYCLSKLSEENKEAVVFQIAVDVVKTKVFPICVYDTLQIKLPEVFCYLLSLMSSEDQLRLFKEHPCEVLLFFFDWPFQNLCLEIAEVVWPFIPESKYEWLLGMLRNYIRRTGYYIPKFFQEFFLLSPIKFRKYLFDKECQDIFFLAVFFDAGDTSNIRVIFENIDSVDKEKLFATKEFLKLCGHFLKSDRYHIVEDCIEIAMLSNQVRYRLKEAFEKYVTTDDFRNKANKNKRKGLFDLLERMNAKKRR